MKRLDSLMAGQYIENSGDCKRFDQALGPQVSADRRLRKTRDQRHYLPLSCTGAVSAEVPGQIQGMHSETDLTTLRYVDVVSVRKINRL